MGSILFTAKETHLLYTFYRFCNLVQFQNWMVHFAECLLNRKKNQNIRLTEHYLFRALPQKHNTWLNLTNGTYQLKPILRLMYELFEIETKIK